MKVYTCHAKSGVYRVGRFGVQAGDGKILAYSGGFAFEARDPSPEAVAVSAVVKDGGTEHVTDFAVNPGNGDARRVRVD